MTENKQNILLVLAGTFIANGGMYEYFKATLDECLENQQTVAVCCSAEICHAIDAAVTKFPIFGKNRTPSYRSLIVSRELRTQQINSMASAIQSAVDKFKPQTIHFTDITLYSDYLIRSLILNQGLTVIQTLHDPKFHEEKISLPMLFLKKLQYRRQIEIFSKSSKHAFHVHDERLLEGTNFPPNTNFLFKGHPIPRKRVERTRGFKENKVRFGFLGRIEPYKGLDDFYSAVMLVLGLDVSIAERIEIVIVGNGAIDSNKWHALPCKVVVTNTYTSDLEFHQQMADLDVLVLPYRTATQSGVLALALTYGIPAIGTKVGAIDQMLFNQHNGLLVPPNSPQDLAEALMQILSSPSLLDNFRANAFKK